MTFTCRDAQPLLEAFVDGELSTEQTLSVEAHLESCELCAEGALFSSALKSSIREAVASEAVVSDAFRERVRLAVAAEAVREEERVAVPRRAVPLQPLRNRTIAGVFAIAAGFLFWLSQVPSAQQERAQQERPRGEAFHAAQASLGVDQTLDRLIDYHSSPPQPQVTQPELLPSFEPNVGVRIHLPTFAHYDAKWEGANLVPVRNHQAASLRYRMLGHRVTVYVYDASKVHVDDRLERRMVRNNPIYVGQWRGYNVATKEHRGTGYAAAADLDASDLEQIITEIQ